MEDLKLNIDKLNKSIDDLPEVPRKEDNSIDLEAITIEIDEKDNRIIPDNLFNAYYKELPNKVINQSRSWRTSNGGKIKILGGDPENDKAIQDKGREANASTWVQRRKISDTIDIFLRKKATDEQIEELGLDPEATQQDALVASMLLKAIERGDVQASTFIRDTAGEKPTEKIAAEVETITAEDRERIEKILNREKGI